MSEKGNYPSNEKLIIIPEDLQKSNNAKILPFKNPRSGRSALYIVDFEYKCCYELLAFNEKYRSWFIDEQVISDGSLKIATLFNPIFLILPYIFQSSKESRNVPLDQLLEDKEYPHLADLCLLETDLSCVADRKGSPDLNVWRYNETSTLSWLSQKTHNLAKKLQQNKEVTSQEFSIALNCNLNDYDAYLKLAFGIICEYISEDLSVTLRQHLKLPESVKLKENIHETKCDSNSVKKPKLEEQVKPTKTKSTLSAKKKALAKSAIGTRSISSFFSKKV